MNTGAHTTKWWMAAGLLVGFVLAFFLDLTGLELHQWLGLAVGLAAVVHGWVHRAWIAAMARRLWAAGTGQGRLFFFLDAALAAGLAGLIGTGLLISSWLGLALTDYAVWANGHIAAALVTLGAVVAKVGTHWRWLVTTTRKQFGLDRPTLTAAHQARPAGPSRREFLGLMGMMTVAAAAATFKAVEAVTGPAAAATGPAAVTTTAAASSSAATTCTVRCKRGCSYPGSCRRYSDTNGNGRCDWGECA